jgi:hypothetical protein
MVSRRSWLAVLFGLGTTLGAAPALAQTSTSTSTSTSDDLTASDFNIKLQRPSGDDWVDITTADAALYFNRARCQCDEKVRVKVEMAAASRSKLSKNITTGANAHLYVGHDCATYNSTSSSSRTPYCSSGELGSLNGLSALYSDGNWPVTTTVGKLFSGDGIDCTQTESPAIWLWIDKNDDSTPDLSGSSAPNLGIKLDGSPPSTPGDVVVEGGNEALEVSWASVATDNPDLGGYVVFCMRGDGLVVFDPGFYDDQYMMCESATSLGSSTSTSSLAGNTTATEVAAPAVFQSLKTEYMCSGRLSSSDTHTRLRILQNGIPYTVGVAAVDLSGNISPITRAFVQKPIPTLDFYREYRDNGGSAEGGYCSLAGWTGKPGLLACLAGSGLLGLFFIRRWRRRRSSRGRGLAVLLVLLGVGEAQAQPMAASHEDMSAAFEEPQQSHRTPKSFAFELRFGAYRPDIDSEFSAAGIHPYRDVYGGKRHLMSQFEFDWQFLQAFGSLSLAGVVGYYSQTAKAFEANPDNTPKLDSTGAPIRSGDETNLRLIPTAALLVYRFDVLALRYGIPLVPYAKMGLNYTFWRITDGNGSIPYYKGGHGSGETLGWQAAAGISLMLDFIDPTAARGLDVETGVNHTHLFFEWDKVEANGLGQSHKLHVGDSSWVVGLMCEF